MINKFILKDLEDVISPLPMNKRERLTANRQAQRMSAQQNRDKANPGARQKMDHEGISAAASQS